MSKEKQLSWNDITLDQLLKIKEVMNVEDEVERVIALCEVVYGEDVTGLPINEFNKKAADLKFLGEKVKTSNPPRKITINGHDYFVDCLVGHITTAQYVDFTNYNKAGNIIGALTPFVIPEGHKYNDGYDMQEVLNDVKSMPVPTAESIAFFFERQLRLFIRIFQHYSIKQITKQKGLTKEEKEVAISTIKHSCNLELSRILSSSAK